VDGTRSGKESSEVIFDPETHLRTLRKIWWKAGIVSVLSGIVAAAVVFQMPDRYTAKAVVTLPAEDGKQPALLGALAATGLDIGGASKVEDLEMLFRSGDLAVRIVSKYGLLPVLAPEKYGPGAKLAGEGWVDRILRWGKPRNPPDDWDAIEAIKDGLTVSIDRKTRALTIGFESLSPAVSADIVGYFLDEGKSRLQAEALEKASGNRKFIEEQITRSSDTLVREQLFSKLGQEINNEMMARNRQHFGFRIIDSARVPREKSGPKRIRTVVLAMVSSYLAVFLGVGLFRARRGTPGS
jgi:uncharacterized protein involved in exopolysaccharide biosynthesis